MQMAPRRRNPKGGRHFAGDRGSRMKDEVTTAWIGRRVQSAGHDARIHFSAACYSDASRPTRSTTRFE